MEPFIDGGLIELLILMGIGFVINIIFSNKYLLILYSAISLAAPVILILSDKNDLFYILCGLSFFNSLLLVILLWRERAKDPNAVLFDIDKYKKKIFSKDTASEFQKSEKNIQK